MAQPGLASLNLASALLLVCLLLPSAIISRPHHTRRSHDLETGATSPEQEPSASLLSREYSASSGEPEQGPSDRSAPAQERSEEGDQLQQQLLAQLLHERQLLLQLLEVEARGHQLTSQLLPGLARLDTGGRRHLEDLLSSYMGNTERREENMIPYPRMG